MKQAKEKPEKTPSRFETVCGRIAVRAIMVILPFLVLDFLSPFFLSHRRSPIERDFPVQVVRHPKPYTMFGGLENGPIHDTGEKMNTLGYRGKAPSAIKPDNEFRIFMLGGSTVFKGDPPIAVLLEEEFRKNNKANVQVYNYGVVSSVSSMELSRILFEIVDLEPDLIIMYNGGNDILHPYEYDPRPGYPFNFIVYENNPLLESDIKSYPTLNLLLYGSNLARYLFPRHFIKSFIPLKEERKKVNFDSDQWRAAIAQNYLSNLVKANKISKTFGAGFMAFFQPMVYYKDPLNDREKTHRFSEQLQGHCLDVRSSIFEKKSLLAEQSAPILIDLSDIYDGISEQIFIDTIHTIQENKPVVAKAIYENITKNFKTNKPGIWK